MRLAIATFLALVFALALLVEAVVEVAFGKPAEWIKAIQPYKEVILLYVSFAIGVGGALNYRFDLMHYLGDFFTFPIETTTFGIVITGLVIGRGSNFVHSFYTRILNYKPPVER